MCEWWWTSIEYGHLLSRTVVIARLFCRIICVRKYFLPVLSFYCSRALGRMDSFTRCTPFVSLFKLRIKTILVWIVWLCSNDILYVCCIVLVTKVKWNYCRRRVDICNLLSKYLWLSKLSTNVISCFISFLVSLCASFNSRHINASAPSTEFIPRIAKVVLKCLYTFWEVSLAKAVYERIFFLLNNIRLCPLKIDLEDAP